MGLLKRRTPRSTPTLACGILLAAGALCGVARAGDLRPSPELKVRLTNGQDFQLSKLRGKVVAVEFIFTTCGHCQHLTETTNKLIAAYWRRGFRAVAIACNDGAANLAPAFVEQFHVNHPVGVSDIATLFDYLGEPPHAFQLPQLLFIDRNGKIRLHVTGEDRFFENEEANMRKLVEKLLAESGPAPQDRSRRPQ